MHKVYDKIYTDLSNKYSSEYQLAPDSCSLADMIRHFNIDDVIGLLEEIRDDSELSLISMKLSRKSDLFDKLVLMKSEAPNGWALRLHTYNMFHKSTKVGYVISNLGHEIRDDENHIHEHSWQLASRILMGGFRNHQYIKTNDGEMFTRFNLVPTGKDNVSAEKAHRIARKEGIIGLQEIKDEVYQQEDLVHYPIKIPHKVDTSIAPYVGTTMTLAFTSERLTEHSIFYEKADNGTIHHEDYTLDVDARPYTSEEHKDAINMAITKLKLLKLADTLVKQGLDRFNRFVDPISKQLLSNNVIETELLPTIAMIQELQDEFKDYPIGKITNIVEYTEYSHALRTQIINETKNMNKESLQELIRISQDNLLKGLYVSSLTDKSLESSAQNALITRTVTRPQHVLNALEITCDSCLHYIIAAVSDVMIQQQAAVIVCNSIWLAKELRHALQQISIPEENIKTYGNSYHNHNHMIDYMVNSKQVTVISDNSGRGVDITINPNIKTNGRLHMFTLFSNSPMKANRNLNNYCRAERNIMAGTENGFYP